MSNVISSNNNRVEFLDFLRGIAIFLVFLAHTHHLITIDFVHQFGNLFSRGVQLFYLVSGYTIFMIYIDKLQNRKDFHKYLIKRFFRIMPLLYILIPVYYFTFGLSLKFDSSLPDWYHILSHYTLLFGFHSDTMSSIIAPAWSIFDEFLFYIILGVSLLIFNVRNNIFRYVIILLIISFLTFILSNIFYSNQMILKTYLFLSPLTQIFIFFVGGGIYIMSKKITISKGIFSLSTIILLIYSVFLHSTTLSVYLSVILFSIMILFLSQNKLKYNRFFLFLGKISFSFYLIHYGIIKLFEKYDLFRLNPYLSIFMMFIVTLILSLLSFKYIETVFINIGKNLIKRKYAQ